MVPHRTHKRPPPVPILSQIHPVPTIPSHFLKIYFNIILPSTISKNKNTINKCTYVGGLKFPGIVKKIYLKYLYKFQTCTNFLIFLTIPGIFGSPHLYRLFRGNNSHLFHQFLWEYHFWFTPTFSKTHLGCKRRVIAFSQQISWKDSGKQRERQSKWPASPSSFD